MTQANENNPGGIVPDAGGDGKNGDDQGSKFVSREAYERTVDKEKALKQQLRETNERLAKFEQQQKAIEEQKLLEQNQHLTVIEQLKKENEALKGNLTGLEQQRIETRKLNSAMGLLNQKKIQLDPKYLDMIPLDQIQVDADGRPDMASVVKAVDNFVKEHPRLVTPLPNDLPGTKPGGSGAMLTYDEWTKLPPKEKKDRFKDIRQ